MKGRDYSVAPHARGWQVRKDGASRASSVHATKDEAAAEARRLAGRSEGELRIKGRAGRIQNANTYGPRDPNPPRDRRR